ncbi:MAG: hypothetical protein PF692_07450 [Kiritimatiellae bacterium]|jgi:hypothetical protein|nr:hypothetical protein [Kiritimatiellia bacterium]
MNSRRLKLNYGFVRRFGMEAALIAVVAAAMPAWSAPDYSCDGDTAPMLGTYDIVSIDATAGIRSAAAKDDETNHGAGQTFNTGSALDAYVIEGVVFYARDYWAVPSTVTINIRESPWNGSVIAGQVFNTPATPQNGYLSFQFDTSAGAGVHVGESGHGSCIQGYHVRPGHAF